MQVQGLWIQLPLGDTHGAIQPAIALILRLKEGAQEMLTLRRLPSLPGHRAPAQGEQNGDTLPSRNHAMRIREQRAITAALGMIDPADAPGKLVSRHYSLPEAKAGPFFAGV